MNLAKVVSGTQVSWEDTSIASKPMNYITPVWRDTRVVPLYVTATSLVSLILFWVAKRYRQQKGLEQQRAYNFNIPILKKNLLICRILEVTRLVGCIALDVILVLLAKMSQNGEVIGYWMLLSGVVATNILAAASIYLISKTRSVSYAVSAIHFSALIVFTYHDLLPSMHLRSSHDSYRRNVYVWLLSIISFYTGFIVPIFMPYFVKHVDPDCTNAPNPSEVASIFSFLTHSYIDPLIYKAYKKTTLVTEDLPAIRDTEKADHIKKIGYPYMDPQLNGPRWSLLTALWGYMKIELAHMFICMLITIVNDFAIPIATLNILGFLEAGDEERKYLAQPWVWIIWLVVGPIIGDMAYQVSLFVNTHMMVRLENLVSQLVFDHAIRVRLNTASVELEKDRKEKEKDAKKKEEERNRKKSQATPTATSPPECVSTPPPGVSDSRNGTTANDKEIGGSGNGSAAKSDCASTTSSTAVASEAESSTAPTSNKEELKKDPSKEVSIQAGSIANLLTVDATRLGSAVELGGVKCVFNVALSFAFLYRILGWSSLIGVAIIIVSLPLPAYLVKFSSGVQKRQMKRADERLQIVTQVMNVLRMIKLFGWEAKAEEKIKEKRAAELKHIWIADMLSTGSTTIVDLFPLGAMLGTYACYTIVVGLPLKASLIFSSIALFDMLKLSMTVLSFYVPYYVKGKVSIDRIAAFLKSGEPLNRSENSGIPEIEVSIRDTEFSWNTPRPMEDEETARRFCLRIEGELNFVTGKINLITGPTGCGKTSLLMSLLGEMISRPLSENSQCILSRECGVAYAAQESWVMNDTIKDNILFGSEYDEHRYQRVINQTALDKDLSMFDAGDITEVGEKGVTLSGGQKARITLARAVYSKAAVVLLDDILSALDVHTAKWIVSQCLAGDLLKNRTVLLVTHNVVLAQTVAEYMVLLSLNGTMRSCGPVGDVIWRDASLHAAIIEKEATSTPSEKEAATKTDSVEKSKAGKLIVAEELVLGHVGWPAYKLYLAALGGPFFYTMSYTFILVLALSPLVQKAFLAYWSGQYDKMPPEQVNVKKYLLIYGMLCLGGSLLTFSSWILYCYGMIRASLKIHTDLVHSVITSTLRWLDTTPISRVITRCSQDIATVDDYISTSLYHLVSMATKVFITATTVVVIAGWPMLLPSIAIITFGLAIGHVYMTAQLPAKRLMSNAKSPILSHIQTALMGVVSVRAYGAQTAFQLEMRRRMDSYSTVAHPYWDMNRWISIRIEALGSFFSGAVATWLIYGIPSSSGAIGFTLVLISSFNGMLLQWVRLYNRVEVQANSLERIRDFLMIEHEPQATEDGKPPAYWPASGNLHIKNLTARYSDDSPPVLKEISFTIKGGERVGVVGRTGAGKSSLALALLRAIPTEGTVLYDGLDVNKMNLDALRANLSIIPQSPELLAGTLRENLDPMEEHNDAVLNNALNQAGLSHLKVEGGNAHNNITLDSKVETSGSNFSQGQRQIIALARAFVRRTKILIMDEATAAIDYETDNLIQQFIRDEFQDTTVITVAHRLQTIMNSDKILVLDAGRLKEWGSPKKLLEQKAGAFKSLVDESSDKKELYRAVGIDLG